MTAPAVEIGHVPGVDGGIIWGVVEARLPETIGFVPTLSCYPKTWKGRPPAMSLPEEQRAVKVESVPFEKRFVASVANDQEQNWLVQLFSPSFLDWLTTGMHDELGFELHEGILRCFRPGPVEGPEAERMLAEAKVVAERVRSEAEESEGLGVRELSAGVSERIERAVNEKVFEVPPASSIEASTPFRAIAARDPRVYIAALGGIVAGFSVLFGLLLEFGLDAIDLIVTVIGWIGPDKVGVSLVIFAFLAWIAAIPESIKIASRRYGRVAFAREYARSRGLGMESPQSFHRRLMRTELPAPAQFVCVGELADAGSFGRLVLSRSATRVFHSYWDSVVVEPPAGMTEDCVGPGWRIDGGQFVVSRSAQADRAASDLDAFIAEALELRDEAAARQEVRQTETSSTSESGN